jgi:steroid 5-alpha reductase family enzyme
MGVRQQAVVVVPSVILVLATAFGTLGYSLGNALGMPGRLGLPLPLRAAGVVVLGLGLLLLGWLCKYRSPIDILVSTYLTMRKATRRAEPQDTSSRTETLVLEGPQRYVRHPMYFAVVVLFVGWWLVLDITFVLFMAMLFFLWFNLVVIPFEEKELRALYPAEYAAYARAVPRFLPAWKRRWP